MTTCDRILLQLAEIGAEQHGDLPCPRQMEVQKMSSGGSAFPLHNHQQPSLVPECGNQYAMVSTIVL